MLSEEAVMRIACKLLVAFVLVLAFGLAAFAQDPSLNRTAVLTWDAPTACVGGAPIGDCPVLGYSVQKRIGTIWTEIGTTTASTLTYRDQNLSLGTHTYRVLATSEAGPSAPSNEGSKSFNVPGAPGNLVITVTITVSQ